MQEKLLARTDKAEIYHLPDGSVLKRYFVENAVERVEQDQRGLQYMQENFGEVYHQDWLYRVVKLLWLSPDRKAFRMEFASGHVLSAMSKSKIMEAEYRCGIWMALYHNKIVKGNTKGLIFTDLNVHNILLDYEQKCVTVIDPGMTWGRLGYRYEDLIKHINNTLTVLIIRRRAPSSAFMGFLKGYSSTIKTKLNPFIYYKSLFRGLRRQRSDYAAQSYLKSLAFLIITAFFLPVYLFLIPGYLFSRDLTKSYQKLEAIPKRENVS